MDWTLSVLFFVMLAEWMVEKKNQTGYLEQWEHSRTRRENLIRLGIEKQKAYEWTNTCESYWRVSKIHILHRSLTDKELALRGYEDISAKYQFIHSNY